jgi:hypothetical protein
MNPGRLSLFERGLGGRGYELVLREERRLHRFDAIRSASVVGPDESPFRTDFEPGVQSRALVRDEVDEAVCAALAIGIPCEARARHEHLAVRRGHPAQQRCHCIQPSTSLAPTDRRAVRRGGQGDSQVTARKGPVAMLGWWMRFGSDSDIERPVNAAA